MAEEPARQRRQRPITVGDGVDPNRNFPNHWGYDNEGSSPSPSSDTYRGGAGLEPETVAMKGLLDRIGFAFQVNYHSNGRWLLYAEGWQIGTSTADDRSTTRCPGTSTNRPSKVPPGLSSDVLYVTNGETTGLRPRQPRHAGLDARAVPRLPQLRLRLPGRPGPRSGRVRAQSVRAVGGGPAADPDDPKSVVGLTTKPFYLESEDLQARDPGAHLKFSYSYGDPQPVAVIAKRASARSRQSEGQRRC